RTVRFISGIHFPPGVTNTLNAALYGIDLTNRGCDNHTQFNPGKAIPPPASINGKPCNSTDRSGCGMGIATGKADLFDSDPTAVNPGGIPIFKGGRLVGGIGVAGVRFDAAEFAALAGSTAPGFGFGPIPFPNAVILDGIQLPFANQLDRPGEMGPVSFPDTPQFLCEPIASPLGAAGVPVGYLVGPRGSAELSADDVNFIVNQAVTIANQARAAIRLPLGSKTRMMISVSDLQ